LDQAADRISWVQTYSGGDCFYATTTLVSDENVEIEGFGAAVEPFERMMEAFQAKFGVEPEVSVRRIRPTQCAVTDFLHSSKAGAAEAPRLVLERTSVPNGSPIRGELAIPDGRSYHLLLIDHRGMAFNLDNRLTATAKKATFEIPIGLSSAEQDTGKGVPQIMIAIIAERELRSASFSKPIPAAEVLPAIGAELRAGRGSAAATAKFFRLGG
jgi:serine/threonine-protein kinase